MLPVLKEIFVKLYYFRKVFTLSLHLNHYHRVCHYTSPAAFQNSFLQRSATLQFRAGLAPSWVNTTDDTNIVVKSKLRVQLWNMIVLCMQPDLEVKYIHRTEECLYVEMCRHLRHDPLPLLLTLPCLLPYTPTGTHIVPLLTYLPSTPCCLKISQHNHWTCQLYNLPTIGCVHVTWHHCKEPILETERAVAFLKTKSKSGDSIQIHIAWCELVERTCIQKSKRLWIYSLPNSDQYWFNFLDMFFKHCLSSSTWTQPILPILQSWHYPNYCLITPVHSKAPCTSYPKLLPPILSKVPFQNTLLVMCGSAFYFPLYN